MLELEELEEQKYWLMFEFQEGQEEQEEEQVLEQVQVLELW